MQIRAMGPGAGWRWLRRGINLGAHNPRAIFGAAALLMLVALVPSVIQLVAQLGFGLQGRALLSVVGVVMLVSLVVYPLLIGGFLRIIDASEHGRPTRATALFDTFRGGHGGGRMIGFGLLMAAVYLVVFLLVLRAFGSEFLNWYWQVVNLASAQQPGQLDPASIPPMPAAVADNFGRVVALGSVCILFLAGIYAIGFGQVALAGRGVGGAMADGIVGTLKNLLPLLVLVLCAIVLGLLLLFGVGLLVMLLAALGALVHPSLSMVLALPVYVGMLLVLYVVIFGVMYHLWRDVCGAPPAPREDEVAL